MPRRNKQTLTFPARPVVADEEDPESFEELADSLIARFQPRDAYAHSLVRTIALCTWRLERLDDLQTEDLERAIDHETYSVFTVRGSRVGDPRYEARLVQQQSRALELLERARKRDCFFEIT